jgi:hypothetical protein
VGDPLVGGDAAVVADGDVLPQPAGIVELDAVLGVELDQVPVNERIADLGQSVTGGRIIVEQDAVRLGAPVRRPGAGDLVVEDRQLLDRGGVVEVDVGEGDHQQPFSWHHCRYYRTCCRQ